MVFKIKDTLKYTHTERENERKSVFAFFFFFVGGGGGGVQVFIQRSHVCKVYSHVYYFLLLYKLGVNEVIKNILFYF